MKKKVLGIVVLLALVCTSMVFAKAEKCKDCNGKGKISQSCEWCGGKGERRLDEREMMAKGTLKRTEKCTQCNGKGKRDVQCYFCNGKGKIGQLDLDHDHDDDHDHQPVLWLTRAEIEAAYRAN